LVVNTASYCGFTQQYAGLEALYARYKDSGLVVLGFPSNDFGNQEPGTSAQIAEFCSNTFGVKFPMFAKTRVVGPQSNPLFSELSRLSDAPSWNFHKYLIDRKGRLVRSYASAVSPSSRTLVSDIERALRGSAS
jgi:glutathione peroxidase